MANEQYITIRGRLTADPELRFGQSGGAIASFTIAANARKFDKSANEFKDKDAIFWRCSAFRDMAENIAESLVKGSAVVALAELESRSFETREGEKRTVTEAKIEAIGPDLRYATAKVTKAQRNGGQGTSTAQPAQSQQAGWGQAPAQPDPWSGGQQSAWPSEPGGPAPF
ncbi:single-stranded DNA-binding protein [Micrococcus terreus]|uniref:single-stranded DNA-binding protein n=1 Tax=Micrococcus terreus TaxID=574650 RepID=UPI0033DDCF5E